MINRRLLLSGAAVSTLATSALPGGLRAEELRFGAPAPFSFEGLKERARELALRPLISSPRPPSSLLEPIDYDAHGRIKFKTDLALWAKGPGRFPVTFFHLGRFFQSPVRMHVVEGGDAREIIYDPAYFDMPPDSPGQRLGSDGGFAGFRYQESRDGRLDWRGHDWVAFLGASYFRAIGELYQYGLSARGIAIDTVLFGRSEEFPAFTDVFFEPPEAHSDTVTLCALLEGPSVAGAFQFTMTRTEAVVMDVQASLHLRQDVGRLGIAPVTSMYWFSETTKPTAVDWRPEVHDSDGLAIWTGSGERIWRPLNSPPHTTVSSFMGESPRGFGLMQRDRMFDHYQDGVHYERRPSLWIEPLGDWGRGSVQLVEIPTDDEVNDNIVAMWVPAEPARAGQAHHFRYRMHWVADEPYPSPLARCIATRLGQGGEPGTHRPPGVRKFVVEFLGEPLTRLPSGIRPETVISTSHGIVSGVRCEAVPDNVTGHWRAEFDLRVERAEPVEIRLFLRRRTEVLTETWLFQYHPSG